jgi:hypothetical protein
MRRTRTSHPPTALFALGLLAALLGAEPARAQAPISAARYLAPPGFRSKEFTFVRNDGWFHIFYIRENLIVGAPTERSLGHAMSRDLYTWTEQDSILPVIEGTFEGTQIWAPHLVRANGLWHLFYPAMRHDPAQGYHLAQTMTVATSPDLFTWTRRETPLFDNSIFPWAWHDTTVNLGMDCRDPYVHWDPVRGEWLMYVSTRPAFDHAAMVIGIAGSSDLEHWQDRGYVGLTLPGSSFSDVAESPLILQRDAAPLLFMWTTNAGQSLTYATSNDLVQGWANSRRLRTMLNYTTVGWWAAETLLDGPRQYFATVHDVWVNFWDLTWISPEMFLLTTPDRGQVLGTTFDRDQALPGDSVTVVATSIGIPARKVGLRYVRVRGSAVDTLVAANWGLPDSVLTGPDTAFVSFHVPAALGDGRPCLLAVAATGVGATEPADTLRVGFEEPAYDDPPDVPYEPVVVPLKPVFLPRRRIVEFTRPRADGPWTLDVFDVRGRLLWSGRAAAGERTTAWAVGAARPGVYFARARFAGAASAGAKFVIY